MDVRPLLPLGIGALALVLDDLGMVADAALAVHGKDRGRSLAVVCGVDELAVGRDGDVAGRDALGALHVEQGELALRVHGAGGHRAAELIPELSGLRRGVEELSIRRKGQVRGVLDIQRVQYREVPGLVVDLHAEDAAVFSLGIGADIGDALGHNDSFLP